MLRKILLTTIISSAFYSSFPLYSIPKEINKPKSEIKQSLNVIEVNDPNYFQKNLINNADLYLINTALNFRSGTKISFSEKTIIKKGKGLANGNQLVLININNVSNLSIEGGIVDGAGTTDAILIGGGSNDISIRNMVIRNAGRFGLQVYGVGNRIKPHHVTLSRLTTKACKMGGIYINSANNVLIEDCSNDGGLRHIGVESPKPRANQRTLAPYQRYAHDIKINRCISENTTGFGIQLYYADQVSVENCSINGSKLNTADKSCITVDRSTRIKLNRDTALNSPLHNVFITGSEDVTINDGYFCSSNGHSTQIHAIFNTEYQEDAVIRENRNIRIENNLLSGGKTGILLNGCLGAAIKDNRYLNTGKHNIYIMEQTRSKDLLPMRTSDVVIKEKLERGRVYVKDGLSQKVRFE